jgi:hypothetical protein
MTRIPSHTIEDAPEASRDLLADMVPVGPEVGAVADGQG